MHYRITNLIGQRLVSRWVVLLIDLLTVAIGFVLAYFLRFNFVLPTNVQIELQWQLGMVLAAYLSGFLIFKPYSGIIRYSSLEDVAHVIWANLLAVSLLFVLNLGFDLLGLGVMFRVPFSILIIDFLMATFLMVGLRFAIRSFYNVVGRSTANRRNVFIYGAGHAGLVTKHALSRERSVKYKLIAFVDDDSEKVGKQLEGTTIMSPDRLSNDFVKRYAIHEVIIASQTMTLDKKREVVDQMVSFGLRVQVVPPTTQWINGQLTSNQIKKVSINDLLGRAPIKLNSESVRNQVYQKIILITGAAGSIGSELARQIYSYGPEKLVLIDQAESPLHELLLDLKESKSDDYEQVVRPYLADVTDLTRMDQIFSIYRPDMIYHAAAYKHVPMMEAHPSEAIKVNVLGTSQLADLAVKYRAKEFVMVSTDKAVNPTNVMGASKRIAEMYCQSYTNHTPTKFVTTRFGNVLGSNGSVIPLFKKQIAKGGPLTVTHPDVTRYFMTIPEACQLVLEAGVMGNGGEIYVFDMGKPIKIIDLARKMIQLSGLIEGEDIKIDVTGLRPGEKLYEELLSDKENTLETHHPKIQIAQISPVKHAYMDYQLTLLNQALRSQNDEEVVKVMKTIVPEFISKNSVFEKFDLVKEKRA